MEEEAFDATRDMIIRRIALPDITEGDCRIIHYITSAKRRFNVR